MAAEKTFFGIFNSGNPGNRGDYLVLLLPGIGAIVRAQDVAANDFKFFPELILVSGRTETMLC
jgi:hypothetical protein